MKNATQPILKHLDSPIRVLAFSIGDLVGYLIPFFIGSLLDSLFLVPTCGVVFVLSIKKWIKRRPRFYFIRWLYWVLPTTKFNQVAQLKLPLSNKRLWVK